MAWQTPVYDREYSDVEEAKRLINKVKNSGYGSLTQQEKSDWDSGNLKGCRNKNDLNRIENNCAYLSNILGLDLETKTDWDYSTTPLQKDIKRIRNNVLKIKNRIYEIISFETNDVPDLPINTYYKMNNIEHVLYLIYQSLSDNQLMRWHDLDDINETWNQLDNKELLWKNAYILNE